MNKIIKTWWERLGQGYIDSGADLPEEVAMKAEIAELRAYIAELESRPAAPVVAEWLAHAANRFLQCVNENSDVVLDIATAAALTEYDRARAELQKALAANPVAGSPVPVPGLGSLTNEDDGVLTLRFKDEDAAQAFMQSYSPTVDCRDMPDVAGSPAEAEPTFSREQVQKWRDDIAYAAADIVARAAPSFGDGDWSWLMGAIRALAQNSAAPEPDGYMYRIRKPNGEAGSAWWTYYEWQHHLVGEEYECRPFYFDARPATVMAGGQPMPASEAAKQMLPQDHVMPPMRGTDSQRDADDAARDLDKTMKQRDDYHDMADKLAEAIAAHFGVYLGEHSSDNCPWTSALEIIESATQLNSDPSSNAGSARQGGNTNDSTTHFAAPAAPTDARPAATDAGGMSANRQQQIAAIRRLVIAYGSLVHSHWPLAPMTAMENLMGAIEVLGSAPTDTGAGGMRNGWRDALRWSKANTDYHGLIALTPGQLEHFVSMLIGGWRPSTAAQSVRDAAQPTKNEGSDQ